MKTHLLNSLSTCTHTLEDRLHAIVDALGREERNLGNNPSGLNRAALFIESYLERLGMRTQRQTYSVGISECFNIEAVSESYLGNHCPHWIIGAHYDSAPGTPGADDNVSAVAIMLESAFLLSQIPNGLKNFRFVAFTNEEPPYFTTEAMGSRVHASSCTESGDHVLGMLCLESLGYFTNEPDSQELPEIVVHKTALPTGTNTMNLSVGNFLALIADENSKGFLDRFHDVFAEGCSVPLLSAIAPDLRLSDQFPYWDECIPALMLTDTALFRNPNYHRGSDLPETLDYRIMAMITKQVAASLLLLSEC